MINFKFLPAQWQLAEQVLLVEERIGFDLIHLYKGMQEAEYCYHLKKVSECQKLMYPCFFTVIEWSILIQSFEVCDSVKPVNLTH